jgi:hypothetical protein
MCLLDLGDWRITCVLKSPPRSKPFKPFKPPAGLSARPGRDATMTRHGTSIMGTAAKRVRKRRSRFSLSSRGPMFC